MAYGNKSRLIALAIGVLGLAGCGAAHYDDHAVSGGVSTKFSGQERSAFVQDAQFVFDESVIVLAEAQLWGGAQTRSKALSATFTSVGGLAPLRRERIRAQQVMLAAVKTSPVTTNNVSGKDNQYRRVLECQQVSADSNCLGQYILTTNFDPAIDYRLLRAGDFVSIEKRDFSDSTTQWRLRNDTRRIEFLSTTDTSGQQSGSIRHVYQRSTPTRSSSSVTYQFDRVRMTETSRVTEVDGLVRVSQSDTGLSHDRFDFVHWQVDAVDGVLLGSTVFDDSDQFYEGNDRRPLAGGEVKAKAVYSGNNTTEFQVTARASYSASAVRGVVIQTRYSDGSSRYSPSR